MFTKLNLQSSVPLRIALALVTVFIAALFGCSGLSTPSLPEDAAATPVDSSVVEATDVLGDAEALDSAEARIEVDAFDAADVAETTKLPCAQGKECIEPLGTPCGSLVCTPCGWQSNVGDCDAGSDAGDAIVEADAPSESGGDTADSFAEVLADSGDTGSLDVATDTPTDTPAEAETPKPPKKFGCTGWKRDPKFDAFKIDGLDVEFANGIKGLASHKIYVTANTSTKGAVAFWNGTSWSRQDVTPTPTTYYSLNNVDGTSETDLWAAGRDDGQGRLYHRGTDATWKEDLTAPYAKAFEDVYAASSYDVFLLGRKATGYKVWRKSSISWPEMTLPSLIGGTYVRLLRIWGLDANNIFVTGYYYDTAGASTKGILLYWNGSTWTEVTVPAGNVQNDMIHGTSLDDLFVTSKKSDGNGVIYRLTDKLATWTEIVNSAIVYSAVWSKYSGTALVGGSVSPASAGTLRITTVDQASAPKTSSVDSKAREPSRFWVEADGKAASFLHTSVGGGIIAGFYTGTCD